SPLFQECLVDNGFDAEYMDGPWRQGCARAAQRLRILRPNTFELRAHEQSISRGRDTIGILRGRVRLGASSAIAARRDQRALELEREQHDRREHECGRR